MIDLKNDSDLKLNGFTVVKFYGEWCIPCKRLDSILQKMEKEFSEVTLYSVDIDKFLDITKNYRILSVPTMIFFNGTKEALRLEGLVTTETLRKSFKNFTNKK